jgi:hypothetical protein
MTDKRPIRFVGEGFLNESPVKTQAFDKTGTLLDEEGVQKVAQYAKVLINSDLNRTTHYICTYQGTPLDPSGPYGRRERILDTKMQRVSKNTFDLYLTYLKTNNSIYLTKAQRGMLND